MAEIVHIQCGFCLNEEDLENPKSLPCKHVHCQPCLTTNHSIYGVLRCPWCREVYDVTADSLPSANVQTDNSISCDVCKKKGKHNQPASTYCTVCRKLYCTKHQESHDDLNEEHQRMTISDYRAQAKRLERKVCPDHIDCEYYLGCTGCARLFCSQCIPGIDLCDDGSAHQLVNIDELVKGLVTVDQLLTEEDRLSVLFKRISKVVSDFDTETADSLRILHEHRDQQLLEVKLKYETLETEFLSKRTKTKSDLTRYMEEEVGTLWSNLSKSRMKIEAQLKQSHLVDIVQSYTEINDKIQKLLSVEIPELELCDVMTLEVKGEQRDIEVEIVSTTDLSISVGQGMTSPAPSTTPAPSTPPTTPTPHMTPMTPAPHMTPMTPVPPMTCVPPTTPGPIKSLTLIQTVGTSGYCGYCSTVCTYEGVTYVGHSKGIDRIDGNYHLIDPFITNSHWVYGITVHKDLLYTLVGNLGVRCVNVYNLSGTLVTRWWHGNFPGWYHVDFPWFNKLVIVDDKVVVPNRRNKQLTLYSLTGGVIKHIPCPTLSHGLTAICAADRHCVVVSDTESSQVFKLDLNTKRVIWISKDIPEPQGVICYKNRCVLVAHRSGNGIVVWILDIETGTLISKLESFTLNDEIFVPDLEISDHTLP